MTIGYGVNKQVRYKKEATWGVAPGATGGQLLRRVKSTLDLKKQTFKSNEIRPDMQLADFRHGSRSVDGKIEGELSVGTYAPFMAAVLRQAWQAGPSTGAQTTITSAVVGNGGTFTRSAGSFLTDGFMIGDVVRWTGWTAPATANNATNFYITGLTATVMTGFFLNGSSVVAKAAGDSVTCSLQGKRTWTPTTGQTNDSFTFEHWFADVAQSEVFLGCRVSQIDFNFPSNGMATAAISLMGKDINTSQAAYFTSPTAITTATSITSATNGAVYVGGNQVANITGMTMSIKGNLSLGDVVGSNTTPDIFQGMVEITGQVTMYFQDNTVRDLFINETEAAINFAFAVDTTGASSFMAFTLPRVKMGGANKDDSDKGIIATLPFTALLNINGGGNGTLQTTLSIQDSSM